MSDNREPERGEVYSHYKGGRYTVECVSTHTETGERLVTYFDSGLKLWSRPVSQWFEEVAPGQARFTLLAHTLEYIIRQNNDKARRNEEDRKRAAEEIERMRRGDND